LNSKAIYVRLIFAFSLLLISFVSINKLNAQGNPLNNAVFLQDEVATVKIFLAQDDLDFILNPDNKESNIEFPATFIYVSSMTTDTVENIGFRLRGNTSRSSAKKSFKVSFNTFIQGQKYKGIEKMNLNGEHNDVSIMRAKISHEILNDVDLFASRTSHVKLFINNEYKGLYLNVEHIDDEFIKKRFPDDDQLGNLYKCNYGADLSYWGSNPSNYYETYELKTNKQDNDYGGLINFLNSLNSVSDASFPCLIESQFDVYSYLKSAAFEILIGHWDGYIFNKNNFYLYQRPTDGRFVYISYDLDNTFGIDWFNTDWSTRNIYNWQSNQDRPLFDRLMSVPYYKEVFTFIMEQILQQTFKSELLIPRLNQMQNLIRNAAHLDEYKGLDYGFSNTDFDNAISEAWGNHVSQSLEEYILSRQNSAFSQFQFQTTTQPCLNNLIEAESKINQRILIKTIDILGKEIDPEINNELKFLIYSDGTSEKRFEIE
jgi:spore coat protein CotH